MNVDMAVIGGVGFSIEGLADEIETPYGKVSAAYTRLKNRRLIFISRHGESHLPPHKVNYRAMISAIKKSGAKHVISINTVGTMSFHPIGSLFMPIDFVEFTKARPSTFFEDKVVHIDLRNPYCPELCSILSEAVHSSGLELFKGVYVCSEGPQLESPAQIRMMRQFGDVVGMTGYPEVVLAREQSLCYAALCIVTNPACGMDSKDLKVSEIYELMMKNRERLEEIIQKVLQKIPIERFCSCRDALSSASF